MIVMRDPRVVVAALAAGIFVALSAMPVSSASTGSSPVVTGGCVATTNAHVHTAASSLGDGNLRTDSPV